MTSVKKKRSPGSKSSPTTAPTKTGSTGGSVQTVGIPSASGRYIDRYDIYKPITIRGYTYPLVVWLGNIKDTIIVEHTDLTTYTIKTLRQSLGIRPCLTCAFDLKTDDKLTRLNRSITCKTVAKLMTYGRPSGIDTYLYELGNRRSLSLRAQQLRAS